MIRNNIKLLITSCALLLSQACSEGGGQTPRQPGEKLQVVATTSMITDLVKNIGGEHVEVTGLMGPGVDPHLYKPTQGDLTDLRQADIIFYNGLHLEGKMGEVLQKFGRQKMVYAIGDAIPEQNLLKVSGQGDTWDPHIWFDVSLWAQTVPLVTEKLSETMPEQASYFKQQASAYRQQLQELHQWVADRIAEIPEEGRVLVTAHDAFEYFGRAYGIEVRGLQGISTLSEFGLRDIKQMVDFVADNNIKAVFVESSVPARSLEAVVEGAEQRGHQIKIGGTLYSDAMGAPDSDAGTYTGMVRSNVKEITAALAIASEPQAVN